MHQLVVALGCVGVWHSCCAALRCRLSLSQPGCFLPLPMYDAVLCPALRSPACSTRALWPSAVFHHLID